MYGRIRQQLSDTLDEIEAAGLYKHERQLTTPQGAHVATRQGPALNFCANNYLGLADHPTVVGAAREALERWGFGMASVRFICGTQTQHDQLEDELAEFSGHQAAILYSSCFDANGGVFEVLFGADDAIISDELNHASIIDGVRLSKAARYRYRNADMSDLRAQLVAARSGRSGNIVIVTDGVCSMDGSFAPLVEICDLADEFEALVMVDDSHAVGFVGPTGRGTPELLGVIDRVDIVSGTLGKALGGASGGYIAAHQEIVDLLRQRSRPYLFSNAVAPSVVAGSLAALALARDSAHLRVRLNDNAARFRSAMTDAGFELLPGSHPIVPVMFAGQDGARRAADVAETMLANGVYVVAFSYPVVPLGKARIR
ncbi:MAG TPA: glycine C-acetyltransferase, partial [Ilumatobacteraceae bacterium]|nr:glycine C-acetyltransferase [Ilumatobacteraceae bacterium]